MKKAHRRADRIIEYAADVSLIASFHYKKKNFHLVKLLEVSRVRAVRTVRALVCVRLILFTVFRLLISGAIHLRNGPIFRCPLTHFLMKCHE